MGERKTKKLEEKNKIIKTYLVGESKGIGKLARDLDVSNSMIERWIKQYLEFGTTVDRRGKASKKTNPNIGRPKKPVKLENMSKEELIEHIKLIEDIKKVGAYLKKQKKNTK